MNMPETSAPDDVLVRVIDRVDSGDVSGAVGMVAEIVPPADRLVVIGAVSMELVALLDALAERAQAAALERDVTLARDLAGAIERALALALERDRLRDSDLALAIARALTLALDHIRELAIHRDSDLAFTIVRAYKLAAVVVGALHADEVR